MSTSIKVTRYLQRFTVRVGTIASVLDMMRYDNCWPSTEEDSNKLERIANNTASTQDRRVTFMRASRTGAPPTSERWASYGCEVLHVHRVRAGVFVDVSKG